MQTSDLRYDQDTTRRVGAQGTHTFAVYHVPHTSLVVSKNAPAMLRPGDSGWVDIKTLYVADVCYFPRKSRGPLGAGAGSKHYPNLFGVEDTSRHLGACNLRPLCLCPRQVQFKITGEFLMIRVCPPLVSLETT